MGRRAGRFFPAIPLKRPVGRPWGGVSWNERRRFKPWLDLTDFTISTADAERFVFAFRFGAGRLRPPAAKAPPATAPPLGDIQSYFDRRDLSLVERPCPGTGVGVGVGVGSGVE